MFHNHLPQGCPCTSMGCPGAAVPQGCPTVWSPPREVVVSEVPPQAWRTSFGVPSHVPFADLPLFPSERARSAPPPPSLLTRLLRCALPRRAPAAAPCAPLIGCGAGGAGSAPPCPDGLRWAAGGVWPPTAPGPRAQLFAPSAAAGLP